MATWLLMDVGDWSPSESPPPRASQVGKQSVCNAGDTGSIPGLGRFRGGEEGNPLQYSYLEKPHGQRSLAGCIAYSVGKSQTRLQWLSSRDPLFQHLLPPPSPSRCRAMAFLPEPWDIDGGCSGVGGRLSAEAHSLSIPLALFLHACSSSSPTLFLLLLSFSSLGSSVLERISGFTGPLKIPAANLCSLQQTFSPSEPALFSAVHVFCFTRYSFRDVAQLFWTPEQFCKSAITRRRGLLDSWDFQQWEFSRDKRRSSTCRPMWPKTADKTPQGSRKSPEMAIIEIPDIPKTYLYICIKTED